VAYAPLGHGFLTGQVRSTGNFQATDLRASNPRFTEENLRHNLGIADAVQLVAAEAAATPAQVALAWLLAKGGDIAPIPGTRHPNRVEENTAAVAVRLTAEQLDRLDRLPPAAGEHHSPDQMSQLNG
jgi:aryl-alcohol dehydrogenase-like predicted oxidoreductase